MRNGTSTPGATADWESACEQANSAFSKALKAGDPASLDMAARWQQYAVYVLPPQHPVRGPILTRLCLLQLLKFESNSDRSDLDSAVAAGEAGVAATSVADSDMPMCVDTLLEALATRFDQRFGAADLHRVIQLAQWAMDLPTANPEQKQRFSERLDSARRVSGGSGGGSAETDARAAAFERALSAHERFEATGTKSDLDSAIDDY